MRPRHLSKYGRLRAENERLHYHVELLRRDLHYSERDAFYKAREHFEQRTVHLQARLEAMEQIVVRRTMLEPMPQFLVLK